DHICLAQVVLCHLVTTRGKEVAQPFANLRIAIHCKAKSFGDGFAGQIIFRGTESTHENDDVGARKCDMGHADEIRKPVPHDCLEIYCDAKLVQLVSNVKGIRVLPKWSQQLGADSNDLCIHSSSLNEREPL